MMELIPLFEKYDVFDHWNLRYLHLIVLGCSDIALSNYLTVCTEGIDVPDSFGRTALMWAAWRGDSTSMSILLDFGANPQATSFDGSSVLIYATYGGSAECLGLILSRGAAINLISHSLLTPVTSAPKIDNNPAITKLLQHGAAVEASRQQNFSPLYIAALTNDIECLTFLLDCGASTNFDAWNCSNPLSIAISYNNYRMVEELIRHGADISVTSKFQTSYIRCAALFADDEMMRTISRARPAVDITLKDVQGYTAQNRLNERLDRMSLLDPRKEHLTVAFQELVAICAREFERIQCQ